jgi:energy-coupling factor transporter ATP-binding protein EcfA2
VIETLRIENVAIVERAELEFGAGLNVLTGETGAGKSIVLGALALLAGARASAEVIRDGAEEAVVEAVFRTERLPELEAELAARGIPVLDHQLVVRRSVARGGRSRAQVGGQLVPVAALAELFAGRLEISSQHDSQSLLRARATAGCSTAAPACCRSASAWPAATPSCAPRIASSPPCARPRAIASAGATCWPTRSRRSTPPVSSRGKSCACARSARASRTRGACARRAPRRRGC